MQPENSTHKFSWKEEPQSFTSCSNCHLLPTYKYGSLMIMDSPGGGTDHGLERGLQELPLLLQSTCRRKSPSIEWQLAQNIH